jgi:serine/threonine protein kinase
VSTAFEAEVFGKYFLVDRIATGGMAEIFTAKTFSHGGFEQLLVIKRILAHLGENDEFVEMFIDEAKVCVALQHANIIRIYDFGKLLTNYFIAMEWVDGKDARNILKKLAKARTYLPIEFCAYITHEACKGLDYAHKKTDLQGKPYGIVHRDVSPSNILVSYEGDVKVADFGIAKAESNAYNTKDGVLKGKFEYMSPEQANGVEIDHRSDIFSLGIILHEMLTGRRLFKTGSDTGTLERIKKADVPAPSSVNPRVPHAMDRIVLKALACDRAERYQTARELQDELAAFLLPNTPDQLRASVSHFMQQLFRDEISEERQRLRDGSNRAAELRKTTPENWDGQTNTTMNSSYRPDRNGGRSPVPVVLVALLAGVVLLGAGGLAILGGAGAVVLGQTQADPPRPSPEAVAAPKPLLGAIDFLVLPEARLFLDGKPLNEGKPTGAFSLADVAPGPHEVRAEADGHETHVETIVVTAGQTAKLSHSLAAVVVVADNRPHAEPKREERRESVVDAPKPVEVPRAEPKLPGKLSVSVLGGGWATVYVNGEKLKKTAPLSGYELAPGNYTIRVENAAAGIDTTQTVHVDAGGSAKVTARPQ